MSDDSLSWTAAFDAGVDVVDIDAIVAERATGGASVVLAPSARRVLDAIADGASLGTITKLVESDAELSANVARLARSAAHTGSVGEKISVPYAVMRLGSEGVRGVCLTSALAKVALAPGPFAEMRKRVWRECLASALACQALAPLRKQSADVAYLVGLLHDFGKIIALVTLEPDHATMDSDWVDVMERHHCDVGWIMTDAWRLPEIVSAVTATHHVDMGADADPMRAIVDVADAVVSRAAAQRWQISAEEIETIAGVASKDEAMALRIGVAKHPYYLTAIA
jgi:HD-like signal output (HDOD) protein